MYSKTLISIGTGLCLWTLLEYILHRFVFHINVLRYPRLKSFHFMFHGNHHKVRCGNTISVRPWNDHQFTVSGSIWWIPISISSSSSGHHSNNCLSTVKGTSFLWINQSSQTSFVRFINWILVLRHDSLLYTFWKSKKRLLL